MSKDKHKVINLPVYNEDLKQRGSLNLWVSKDIAAQWKYQGQKKRGGQWLYSEKAIELCLVLRLVYGLALRQTEGFVISIFANTPILIPVPDYTTMCRRCNDLKVDLSATENDWITDIAVDSTGLKVYGEGEWKVRKHGAGKHRTWMKLHVAVDIESQQAEAVRLTTNAVDDATEVESLLEQIDKRVGSFRGDGAYDKDKVFKILDKRKTTQVIPPQHNAVVDKKKQAYRTQRDKAIKKIKEIGRADWKKQVQYQQRSKAETFMFRYKVIIGDRLAARKIVHQKTEVALGCKILNIMLRTAKPKSVKVA